MEIVFNQYKELQRKRADEIFSLILEKERIKKDILNDFFIETKYGFFDRIFKHKQYKNYLESKEKYDKEKEVRNQNRTERINEINKYLINYQNITSEEMMIHCNEINSYSCFEDFNVTMEDAISELLSNNIEPEFDSYDEAFYYMPDYFGNNKDFMLKAVEESFKYIIYDKTNSDELYLKILPDFIRYVDENEKGSYSNNCEVLLDYIHELQEPKVVEEGKYKIPHKFMFEEIKKYLTNLNTNFKYTELDGKLSTSFGQEMQSLYEDNEYFLGLHSTKSDDQLEYKIFYQGLKNSMQNADNMLNRTVMFGNDLTFTKALNYAAYAIFPVDERNQNYTNFILKIPYSALNNNNPLPIWCSNNYDGSENYLNPEYVYGMYHLRDGVDREIIHNNLQEKFQYKYLKTDESVDKQVYEMESILNKGISK